MFLNQNNHLLQSNDRMAQTLNFLVEELNLFLLGVLGDDEIFLDVFDGPWSVNDPDVILHQMRNQSLETICSAVVGMEMIHQVFRPFLHMETPDGT